MASTLKKSLILSTNATAQGEQPCILSCSPRKNGNCADVGQFLHEQLYAHGHTCTPSFLTNYHINPCIACDACTKNPGFCVQSRKEMLHGASQLFTALFTAPVTFFISPIYFYHLPAQAKAFIDRAQSYWLVPPDQKPGKGHALVPILLAAREKGDQLFTGTLLSLRYFAESTGMDLLAPLLLYGLSNPDDFIQSQNAKACITAYLQKHL